MNFGYHFKAYDKKGKLHQGTLFFLTEDEVVSFLLKNGLTPIKVKPLSEIIIHKFLLKFSFRISLSQKIFLVRTLYLILKSGLPLEKGFEILLEQSKGGLKNFVLYLGYILQRGEPIYQAFSAFPQAFSVVEVEALKAGEISGNLVETLEKWIENLEKEREIRNEIISSSLYPAIVVFLSFAVLFLLFIFVIPKVGSLMRELIQKPPFLTRVLLFVSDIISSNLALIILFTFLTLISLIFLFLFRKTREKAMSIVIKLPLLSKIYFSLSLGQALFILGSMLKSGIPLTYALKLTAETSFHPNVKNSFLNIETSLKKGKKFQEALQESGLPIFVSSILGVAGETGTIEETLKVLEDYYFNEFRNLVKNVLNLFQPILLIFVGMLVGFVAVTVLVPIYQQVSTQLEIERGGSQIPGSY